MLTFACADLEEARNFVLVALASSVSLIHGSVEEIAPVVSALVATDGGTNSALSSALKCSLHTTEFSLDFPKLPNEALSDQS